MIPRIGELRERVTFQSLSTVKTTAGGRTQSWTNISSVPTVGAKVLPVKSNQAGVEIVEGAAVRPVKTYLIAIRYRSDIDESNRIVWGSKTLNIRTADDREGRKRFLTIEAEEIR